MSSTLSSPTAATERCAVHRRSPGSQSLVLAGWRGMGSKADFRALQAETPLLVSMGDADQRGPEVEPAPLARERHGFTRNDAAIIRLRDEHGTVGRSHHDM